MKTDKRGTDPALSFAVRTSVEKVEEGDVLAPKFDDDGLVPCVTTNAATGIVLILGYMNDEVLRQTIATGEAHYWSRSRRCLWHRVRPAYLFNKYERYASTMTRTPSS